MSCVLTLTLNPAIDQSVRVEKLIIGEVQRATSVRYDAAGKGINVAGCLADWDFSNRGIDIITTGVLGQDNQAIFDVFFKSKNIIDEFIRIKAATRVNIKISDDKTTTDINLPGFKVDSEIIRNIYNKISHLKSGDIAVLSGSIPDNCPEDIYANIIANLKNSDVKIFLDTSGEPLKAVLKKGVLPFALKPNLSELSDALGRDLTNIDDAIGAAQELIELGATIVIISMGSDGALFITKNECLIAKIKVDTVISTVGAGDAMVAGVIAAISEGNIDLEYIARLSTAFAASKIALSGANLPPKNYIETLSKKIEINKII